MSKKIKDAWPLSPARQSLVLINAHTKLRHRYRGIPLWSFVSEMTGHGSGYSIEICKANGWSPDNEARLPISYNLNQIEREKPTSKPISGD